MGASGGGGGGVGGSGLLKINRKIRGRLSIKKNIFSERYSVPLFGREISISGS